MMKGFANILSVLILAGFFSACSYTMKVRDGSMAYEVKQYAVAVELLEKEYNKSKSRVEKGRLAYLLGLSYKELNKSEESIRWFLTAYDYGAGVDALREYAFSLKKAERYKEAIDAFKDLGLEIGSPYEYRREISACEVAMGWREIENPEYVVQLLDFNSGFSDYSPSLYKDNQLVFTSDRKNSTGDETYNWTGNAFSDLFVVDLESNAVSNFDQQLNTGSNEGTVTFGRDFSEVYFSRCFGPKNEDAYCKLMVSEFDGGTWGAPSTLDFIEEGINYGHPSLSADGRFLYFACEHPDGWGGDDIWVSERATDGGWGPPQATSPAINTIGNEKFPYIDVDTLYFSSDFHSGMGGLDIFRATKLSNGSWSPAYNLKPPINSGGDDFGYVIDHQAPKIDPDILQVGYFTSTRQEGIGNGDN